MVALSADVIAIRREIAILERLIAAETERQRKRLAKLEGERDALLARLLDLEGAHDRRYVAVR
jgi:hypothetical protein